MKKALVIGGQRTRLHHEAKRFAEARRKGAARPESAPATPGADGGGPGPPPHGRPRDLPGAKHITMRAVGVELDDELRHHVERRLMFALERFGRRVVTVSVRFDDVNGPRGGGGRRCSLAARLRGAGQVRVEDEDEDFYPAVDRAANRLGRAVARQLERQREARTGVASRPR